MVDRKDRIVLVDATIELGDYFHAHFDAAKTKLIIGCLLVALVIVAFTYFFILIGEQTILWQLSPLFVGLPIVAIAGQFLRIHASYRKYLGNLSESEKNIHYMFHENGDGFDIVRGKNFSHIAWESVRKVIERPRYFRFLLANPESLIIPKKFLRHGSDEKVMREILAFHLGSNAKLLSE